MMLTPVLLLPHKIGTCLLSNLSMSEPAAMKIFDHSGSSRYRSRLTSPPWRRLINGASANAPPAAHTNQATAPPTDASQPPPTTATGDLLTPEIRAKVEEMKKEALKRRKR